MAEIQLREPLASADAALLARCANDDAAWQALPKLGRGAPLERGAAAALGRTGRGQALQRAGVFRLRTFARKSRAEREARALDLVAAAVPDGAVRVLAWAEERHLGCVAWSLLVTAELEQSFDLRRIKMLAASRTRPARCAPCRSSCRAWSRGCTRGACSPRRCAERTCCSSRPPVGSR